MENIKVKRPKWLEELETQINKKLAKEFPNDSPKITDLNLQYEIKEKLDKIKLDKITEKQLVLTGTYTPTYNRHFETLGDKQKEAQRIVNEALYEKLASMGIWQSTQ